MKKPYALKVDCTAPRNVWIHPWLRPLHFHSACPSESLNCTFGTDVSKPIVV